MMVKELSKYQAVDIKDKVILTDVMEVGVLYSCK